jgi:hypothetical protein
MANTDIVLFLGYNLEYWKALAPLFAGIAALVIWRGTEWFKDNRSRKALLCEMASLAEFGIAFISDHIQFTCANLIIGYDNNIGTSVTVSSFMPVLTKEPNILGSCDLETAKMSHQVAALLMTVLTEIERAESRVAANQYRHAIHELWQAQTILLSVANLLADVVYRLQTKWFLRWLIVEDQEKDDAENKESQAFLKEKFDVLKYVFENDKFDLARSNEGDFSSWNVRHFKPDRKSNLRMRWQPRRK